MPFYEYQCKNCGNELEAMQKISDPPLKKCPHCGKTQLQRLMSAPVFRLKGGGWYETDFKDDKDQKRNLAETDTSKEEKKVAESAGAEASSSPPPKPDTKATEKTQTESKQQTKSKTPKRRKSARPSVRKKAGRKRRGI